LILNILAICYLSRLFIVIKHLDINGFATFVVFSDICDAIECEFDVLVRKFDFSEDFLRDFRLSEIVIMHENLCFIVIYDKKAVIFAFIEEF